MNALAMARGLMALDLALEATMRMTENTRKLSQRLLEAHQDPSKAVTWEEVSEHEAETDRMWADLKARMREIAAQAPPEDAAE